MFIIVFIIDVKYSKYVRVYISTASIYIKIRSLWLLLQGLNNFYSDDNFISNFIEIKYF